MWRISAPGSGDLASYRKRAARWQCARDRCTVANLPGVYRLGATRARKEHAIASIAYQRLCQQIDGVVGTLLVAAGLKVAFDA